MKRHTYKSMFSSDWPVIGVIHIDPLPGAPHHHQSFNQIIEHTLADLDAFIQGEVDAVLIENFGDTPFLPRIDTSTVASLAVIANECRRACSLPLGINVLRNDGYAALAIAAAAQLDFIRINILIGAMITPAGIIEGCSRKVAQLRHETQWHGLIAADVFVKHAYPLGTVYDRQQIVDDTYGRGGADIIIMSGSCTGSPPDLVEVKEFQGIREKVPLWIGSGMNSENVQMFTPFSDGALVSSTFYSRGCIDPTLVRGFMQKVQIVDERR